MKAYTDIEQSKKLAEILPRESADQTWEIIAIAGANLDVPEEMEYWHNGDTPYIWRTNIHRALIQLRLQRDIQRLADKMYKSLIEVDGWVNVDERLPEDDSEVGCITADGEIYIDRYVRGTMYGDIWRKTEKKPVKWLPLKPKKGD